MSVVVVLHQAQNIVNIAAVVRAMKNFGFRDLRLVAPREYDPYRIEGIAHNTGDVLARVATFDTLDAALADCTFVAGLTARQRTAKQNARRPRDVAPEILEAAAGGIAAILLGPEDNGLTNEELDRCHRTVTIPTSPRYASLNLAQAFAIMAYEVYGAGVAPPLKSPRRRAETATQDEIELLFSDAERALHAMDFLKTRNPENVMRTLRGIGHRTSLDGREAALLRAMCIEVCKYIERVGSRS